MRKLGGVAKRITAMLLSGMLVMGLASGSIFASEIEVDTGRTSEIAVDDVSSEEVDLSIDEDHVSDNNSQTNDPDSEAPPVDDSEVSDDETENRSQDSEGSFQEEAFIEDEQTEGEQGQDAPQPDVPEQEKQDDAKPDVAITEAQDEETVREEASMGVVARGTCGARGDNLTWILDEEHVLTISGNGDMADDTFGGSSYSNEILSVIINTGVTSIGARAFIRCTGLISVSIPNSVTIIGARAFADCHSLRNVNIPNSVTSIGGGAFEFCTSLISVSIPNSVTSIGGGAFEFCTSLTSVSIPNGVTSIGSGTFASCSSLTSVSIPNSVTSIDSGAFANCLGLSSVSISNRVTSIGDYAFANCSLTNVTIPNSVTSIGNYAFRSCNLTSIYFNGNLPLIGFDSFEDVVATAYYPQNNSTWTDDVKQNYGGTITWVSWNPNVITEIDAGFELYKDNNSFIHSSSNFLKSDEKHYCISDTLYSILTNRADIVQRLYLAYDRHIREWNGSCEGLQIMMALIDSGFYEFFLFDKNSFWEIRSPLDIDGLRDTINYYHLLTNDIINMDYQVDDKQDIHEFAQYLVNEARNGKPFILNYLYNERKILTKQEIERLKSEFGEYSGKGGHSVIVCGYEYGPSETGELEHQIKLYDCNNTGTFYYMNISDDYSAFHYQDSNMNYVSKNVLQNENRVNLQDIYTSMTILKYDTIVEEVLPDMVFSNLNLKAQKTRSSYKERNYLKGSDLGSSDTSRVIISLDCPFTLTNDVGQSLTYDGIITSGNLPVFNYRITGEDNHQKLQFETTKSSSFIISGAEERICFFTEVGDKGFSVNANNATEISISDQSGVSIIGENVSFISSSIDGHEGNELITVLGEVSGNCNIVRGNNNVIVTSDNEIGNFGINIENKESYEEYSSDVSADNYYITTDAEEPIVTTKDEDGLFVPVEITNTTSGTSPSKKDIKSSKITIENSNYTYTGNSISPVVIVTDIDGKTLTEGTDYAVSYSNNTNAGTATVTITGKGNYTGTVSKSFAIGSVSIASATVTGISNKTYNGSVQTQNPNVKVGDKTLSNGTDYTLTYSNNTNAGTATVTITGKGNYSESLSKTFAISAASIASATVTGISNKTYTGKVITQNPTVNIGSTTLTRNTDYSINYSNNINSGTATVTITGIGNYTDVKTATFKINKASQSIAAKATTSSIAVGKTATVSISGANGKKSYKSSNTTVATVDKSTGKVTAKKVGTVKITATSAASSNYKAASKTVTIKVVPAATSKITASNLAKGIKIGWKKVTGANGYIIYRNSKKVKTITSGSTITWTDTTANTNGAKYIYKIVAKANTGTSTLSNSLTTYCVARPAFKTLKNSTSKKMTATWGKNAKATGYQIQYSTSKKFASGNKTATVTKAATVSKTIASLTKGKIYYVRIRAYKTVGKKKYYSSWSATKAVKISK